MDSRCLAHHNEAKVYLAEPKQSCIAKSPEPAAGAGRGLGWPLISYRSGRWAPLVGEDTQNWLHHNHRDPKLWSKRLTI